MAKKQGYLAVRLDADLKAAFEDCCALHYLSPSSVLRVLIHRHVQEFGMDIAPLAMSDKVPSRPKRARRV